MKYDSEGFLAPVVDRSKCTNCGLCRKICPSINLEYKNTVEPACYAAYADDEISQVEYSHCWLSMHLSRVELYAEQDTQTISRLNTLS